MNRKIEMAIFSTLLGVFAADVTGKPPNPKADPRAVVVLGNARFTVLTPRLIRMEWSPTGRFEDRASHAFINRHLPVPTYEKSLVGETLTLKTDRITVRYENDGKPFGKENFKISVRTGPGETYWNGVPPFAQDTNLGGTTRTLDGISGASELEPGLLTRDGWSFIDDSERLLFDDVTSDRPWVARREKGTLDWYVFCYGNDYKQALRDFTQVAGRIPLPPRYVFGAWWSRYWAYSDKELRQLVREFIEHDVPLDVLVIDMDWHLDGWTGYTWNPEYFPDPKGFLEWVHDRGLRATLNLHPADGVGKHEKVFPEMARAMGLDPKKVDRIPFDCTDRKYMDAYFKVLHHPLEKMGVDFWWLDWQQGTGTKIPGLDPLWWLNHLHWADMQRRSEETGRRPLIFSRWGGLGNHRYQIGFSGDTFCNWPSLAFQPYFTSTAGNVGFAYWSHDIGGHQPGPVDSELYARWIQYGVFSPILRTHTTKNFDAERRIWKFSPEVFDAARKAFHFRYELIPYIYTMARKCYDTGLPLCRPLYYEWPDLDESYNHPNQYMFGDDLLVVPVVEPSDPISGCAMMKIWLPPGKWTNWFTGRFYEGPCEARLLVPLDEIPLFVRGGAIIPTLRMIKGAQMKAETIGPLIFNIFPDESGETRLYEDDGVSADYQKGRFAWTSVRYKKVRGEWHITIDPSKGEFDGSHDERQFGFMLHDMGMVRQITVDGKPLPKSEQPDSSGWTYLPPTVGVMIVTPKRRNTDRTEIVVTPHHELQDTTALLRTGARGQLSMLSSVLDGMFILTPDSISEAVSPFYQPISPQAYLSQIKKIQDEWPRYLYDLRKKSSNVIARKFFPRFLGIYYKMNLASPQESHPGFVAEIELAPTLHIESLKKIRAKASVSIDEPWHIVGRREFEVENLSKSELFTARLWQPSKETLQTGILRGEIALQIDDRLAVDIPIERVFLPSINAWWIAGPFDGGPMQQSLGKVFPPENGVDLNASYEGKDDKKIRWRQVKREIRPGDNLSDEFFIDFDDVFGGRVYDAVAYAFTYLEAPEALDASLAIGSDDGVAVWLNGEEVHRNNIGRPYSSKQDRVPVKFKKGINTLLLKINQGGGDWGFCVHVETPGGKPLTAVQARLEPN